MSGLIPPGHGWCLPEAALTRLLAEQVAADEAGRLTAAELAEALKREVWQPTAWGALPPAAEAALVEAIERLAGQRPVEGERDG